MALHVAVIGSGIVGSAVALNLVRDGHRVTLLDPEPAGSIRAASFGHASWISPASVVPMTTPGMWRQLPRLLMDRRSPLTIRLRSFPRLLPWLARFLLSGSTVPRVEATSRALGTLLHDAPDRHRELARSIGREDLIRHSGLLYVYPGRSDFLGEALAWRLRRETGVEWTELDARELRRCEPDLSERYGFAVRVENAAHCFDPSAYVAAIAAAARQGGMEIRAEAATGFVIDHGRLLAVRTAAGRLDCDRAVICAGIWSRDLAAGLGERIRMESERGYHAVVAAPKAGPRTPIMPSDGRMGNTMTAAGLRVAGQVELAATDAEPDWRRVDILLKQLVETYPGLGKAENLSYTKWLGHRPSTSDGLPVIGPSRATADVVYAFGHGHVGFASGPATAAAVSDLVSGRTPGVDLAPFRPGRFSRSAP